MISDKLYSKEKPNLENKSLFKAKDLGSLNEVINYLEKNNLSADLAGSIIDNFYKGNIRHYQDIDLALRTEEIEPFSEDFNNYVNVIRDLLLASRNKKNLNNWTVEDLTKQFPLYVGLTIEYRFKIRDSKTNTEIDLTFGKKNEDYLKNFETNKNLLSSNPFNEEYLFKE